MYNRYVPQPDGSYRRNRMQETPAPAPPRPIPQRNDEPRQEPPQPTCPPEPESVTREQPQQFHGSQRQPCRRPAASQQTPPPPRRPASGVGSFLRQLLPKDFDTEDLLIVLLLLLMSGDSQEDQNTALLTLALYLFL